MNVAEGKNVFFIAHIDLPPYKYTENDGWEKCGFDHSAKTFFGFDPAKKGGDESAVSSICKRTGATYVATVKRGESIEQALRRVGCNNLADFWKVSDEAKDAAADMVNNPPHYNQGKIEVFDFIKDQKLNYAEGCVVKYVSRYKYKGTPLQDLEKAKWYLEKLIKELHDKK